MACMRDCKVGSEFLSAARCSIVPQILPELFCALVIKTESDKILIISNGKSFFIFWCLSATRYKKQTNLHIIYLLYLKILR